jgi:hypothetical protein
MAGRGATKPVPDRRIFICEGVLCTESLGRTARSSARDKTPSLILCRIECVGARRTSQPTNLFAQPPQRHRVLALPKPRRDTFGHSASVCDPTALDVHLAWEWAATSTRVEGEQIRFGPIEPKVRRFELLAPPCWDPDQRHRASPAKRMSGNSPPGGPQVTSKQA